MSGHISWVALNETFDLFVGSAWLTTLCCFKLFLNENLFSQKLHLYSLSPLWILHELKTFISTNIALLFFFIIMNHSNMFFQPAIVKKIPCCIFCILSTTKITYNTKALCSVLCALYTVLCTLYSALTNFLISNPYSVLCTPCSVLCTRCLWFHLTRFY